MTRPRYKRSTGPSRTASEVPVVLPHVVMVVAPDGTMTVTIDGARHDPPPFSPPWRRDAFASIIDHLTGERRSPVRVEVREADGTVFTDIITPGRRRRPEQKPESNGPDTVPGLPELALLRGKEFVPGEDVAIAVVIAHSDAAPDGTARALLSADQLAASPTREVILLGRVSGAVTIGHPE